MKLKRIGNFIAQRRKEKELTQEQLGAKLGVSYQVVSKWERGENLPDSSVLLDLSIILDVSVESILKGVFEIPVGKKRVYVKDIKKRVENLAQKKNLLGKKIHVVTLNLVINGDLG